SSHLTLTVSPPPRPLLPPTLPLFHYCSPGPRALHSFPTRRSSDLTGRGLGGQEKGAPAKRTRLPCAHQLSVALTRPWTRSGAGRSEEHTSELQSRFDLVCRLLLEKKKQNEHNLCTVHRTG